MTNATAIGTAVHGVGLALWPLFTHSATDPRTQPHPCSTAVGRDHGQGDPQCPPAFRAGLHRRIDLVPYFM